MRRIDRDRRQQRLDPFRIKSVNRFAGIPFQSPYRAHPHRLLRQRGYQPLTPAVVLILYEFVNVRAELRHQVGCREPVGPRLGAPLLCLLQQPRHAHFDKFIQIASRNAEKLHPLKKGILGVERLFQHSSVELHPGQMAVKK